MTAIGTRPLPRIGASRLAGLLGLMGFAITAIVLTPAPALAHPSHTASSVVITILGVGITIQTLTTAGILQVRF